MATLRGPDAVRAALVEAAADLFAARGDASIRAVADRAGVNHGLVHHYLGSKRGLRAAVLDRLATTIYADLELPEQASLREIARAALLRTDADPRFVKILARALLDGGLPDQLQTRFPLVERLRAATPNDPDLARAALAEGLALSLGAAVFGPWICAALGLEEHQLDATRDAGLERLFTQLDAVGDPN